MVRYINRHTIYTSVYRPTGSGSDGVPFMAVDYKKPPPGVVFPRGTE